MHLRPMEWLYFKVPNRKERWISLTKKLKRAGTSPNQNAAQSWTKIQWCPKLPNSSIPDKSPSLTFGNQTETAPQLQISSPFAKTVAFTSPHTTSSTSKARSLPIKKPSTSIILQKWFPTGKYKKKIQSQNFWRNAQIFSSTNFKVKIKNDLKAAYPTAKPAQQRKHVLFQDSLPWQALKKIQIRGQLLWKTILMITSENTKKEKPIDRKNSMITSKKIKSMNSMECSSKWVNSIR